MIQEKQPQQIYLLLSFPRIAYLPNSTLALNIQASYQIIPHMDLRAWWEVKELWYYLIITCLIIFICIWNLKNGMKFKKHLYGDYSFLSNQKTAFVILYFGLVWVSMNMRKKIQKRTDSLYYIIIWQFPWNKIYMVYVWFGKTSFK